jgi:hypothetical protein
MHISQTTFMVEKFALEHSPKECVSPCYSFCKKGETPFVTKLSSAAKGTTIRTVEPRKKKTPWFESESELYQPSDRRLTAKRLPTRADRRCHVVSVTDPSGRISRFSREEPLLFYQVAPQFVLARLSGPRSRPTTFFFW